MSSFSPSFDEIRAMDADALAAFVAGDEGASWHASVLEDVAHGGAEGQAIMGLLHMRGAFEPANMARAVEYLDRAAHQRHAGANLVLGGLYAAGTGVKQDARKAVRCWQRSAEGGCSEARFCLGNAYLTGTGVDKRENKGMGLISIAALEGCAAAQVAFGQLAHANGLDQVARAFGDLAVAGGIADAFDLMGLEA